MSGWFGFRESWNVRKLNPYACSIMAGRGTLRLAASWPDGTEAGSAEAAAHAGKFLDNLVRVEFGLMRPPEAENERRYINLMYLNLIGLSAALETCAELEGLYCGGNHLRSIPTAVGNYSALRNLCVSDNFLTELPAELSKCANLAYLNIGRNMFTVLPAWLDCLPRLEVLNVADNDLADLPVGLGRCLRLETLFCEDNPQLNKSDQWGPLIYADHAPEEFNLVSQDTILRILRGLAAESSRRVKAA